MKNLFIGLGVLAMIGATSCKKDHTCECTTSATGFDDVTSSITITDTKKKATDACEATSASSTVGTLTSTVSCELK